MHFGEAIHPDRFVALIQRAYTRGIRSFLTADVYGNGEADRMIGESLAGVPRDQFCLIGAVGHDFYSGRRDGAKGYPRFTHLELRAAGGYRDYLFGATEKSLERCRTGHFDLLLLHNPDSVGYSSEAVWKGMHALKEAGLARQVGIAPGPANGFTLDLILSFERFAEIIQWAMIILNPLEPWPGRLVLPAAERLGIRVITRVVDCGGLFHGDVKPGHPFGPQDHRAFRPAGWVEAGNQKIEPMRAIGRDHGLSLLQLACLWNLAQPAVRVVVPTLIQEAGPGARTIEDKLDDLAALPETSLSPEACRRIAELGENQGCMALKGASREHQGAPQPDRWPLSPELEAVGRRWNIEPDRDLAFTHREAAPAAG